MNRWQGILFYIERPSRKPPRVYEDEKYPDLKTETREKSISISWECAEDLVTKVVGLKISTVHSLENVENCPYYNENIFGTVTEAHIDGDAVVLSGTLQNIPKYVLEHHRIGMSFEARECVVENIYSSTLKIKSIKELCGIAVVHNPAFDSSFEIFP